MARDVAEATLEIEALFPQLPSAGYQIKSAFDIGYNCIAFAAGDTRRWWWPDRYGNYYWPPGVAREMTLPCFVEAFATLNYQPCSDARLEVGYEKVAIYSVMGEPQHAARQLSTGIWVSKLGQLEDIEHHTLEGIEGNDYGRVAQFLKRLRSGG